MTLRLQTIDNNLKGRLALVTGSSGGIGSAVARSFAAQGCDVGLHYSSSKEKADKLAQELSETYPSQLFVPVHADLSQRESTRALVSSLLSQDAVSSKHKAVSILVANAGLGRRIRDVVEIGEDDWDEMMEVNSRSQFVVTKACLAGMRQQGWGRVILVGSIASRGSGLNGCHYAASKGALTSMGQNLATLLAPEGVTVNIVSPAMIGSTGMIPPPISETWDKGCDLEELKKTDPGLAIAASIPIHRLGSPNEVCEAIIMLARNGYMTGQDILLSGVPAQGPRESDQHSEWLSSNLGSPLDQQFEDDEEPTGDAVRLKGHFTSSDLLNPSDALDLLAHVADMEPEGHAQTQDTEGDPESSTRMANISQGVCDYPPVTSGALTLSEASFLIEHAAFDSSRILELIEHEPYLITAILTVATKDDPSWSRAHNACARHMETQISKLIYTGSTTVGAVEALLILAEWAPQPLEENLMIGCGKEDQGSWMLVGVAIRLAYLQNLEQTGLVQRVEGAPDHLSRKRIAWAACYMSDRQVSIRLGKGFWSRGPGPSVNLRAADFPYLQTQKLGNDNLALLFQAHLEITQLFSNAHDILYSSSSHREQLYIGGEYVRYIDDFSSVLRRWKLSWGGLSFIPRVKASLMLSYDFLRLYINAFAFQANLNRIVRRSKKRPSGPLFSELAAAPDARFIYESIDAANSILCTLNSFIDPTEAFKYMPLKFYLYVIYAAVFLFKAIFAGAIKPSEARGVRRAIYETISRLQKTSDNQQGLGQRYARSLRLLWLKMLGKSRSRNPEVEGRSDSLALTSHGALQSQAESSEGHMNSDPFNSFSWKDLHSLGEFISNDGTSLFNDNFIISPEQDSVQGAEGPEHFGGNFYSGSLGEIDIIF
ncbi:3-oxoacyl-reductase [Fusarium denticulatum]|uniref:3-oxoacyl-reductase n=1 Tax=Fusarium denticulatum TaxID=48507 RepID=A0A8H5XDL3_9HYPO|nr:3-oxoacyl-reductase [Fusarium denticulatum]